MLIKLTTKAERGIGLRSMSTGKLRRYVAGDELEVADSIAVGLINSGLAEQIVRQLDNAEPDNVDETTAENAEPDNVDETAAENAEPDNVDETAAENAEPDNVDETAAENAEPDNDETQDYTSMTVKELKEVLKEQGKQTDGTKEELLKRLKEN